MRIISWNCNGALRRKLAELDALQADLLIIQECENPALSSLRYKGWAGDYLWVGSDKNKGIGVFPKNGHTVRPLSWSGKFSLQGMSRLHASTSWSTSDLQLFLPFTLDDDITVLAVWTKGSDKQAFGYIGQLWKYIQIHHGELAKPSTMVVGDLNSNAIWDKPDRWWSHSDVVAELGHLGLSSLYHTVTREQQGRETTPTFYLHRNLEKPYHIDYAFMSEDMVSEYTFKVGEVKDWLNVSDHMPLIIETG